MYLISASSPGLPPAIAAAGECVAGEDELFGLGQGALALAVLCVEQRSISHWLPSKRLAPWAPVSGEFHTAGVLVFRHPRWFGFEAQPGLGVPGLHCPKATAPRPTKASSRRSWMEDRFYSHIATGPDPSFFWSSEKFLSSPTIISIMLLHLVFLLMHYVQVSFIPGSEMLPFSIKRHVDLVGWPMYLNIEKWDKLLLWLAHPLLVLALMFLVHVSFCCLLMARSTRTRGRVSWWVIPFVLFAVTLLAVFAILLSLAAGSHSKVWREIFQTSHSGWF